MKIQTTFALLLLSMTLHGAQHPSPTLTLGEGEMLRTGTATSGALRLSTGRDITTVPEVLEGCATVTSGRGLGHEPGPGFSFRVDQPAVVYIAVFNRGNYHPPSDWRYTGLALGWEEYQDPLYAKEFPVGTVSIPAHDGKAGNYGPPHLAIISTDREQARKLIAKAPERYQPKPPERPGYFWMEHADADHTGGYLEIGEPRRIRFRIRGGNPERDPQQVTLEISEASGDFTFRATSVMHPDRTTDYFQITLPRMGFYEMSLAFAEEAFVRAYNAGLAVAPRPRPADRGSPWGVMKAGDRPNEARMARRLGVSWIRHSLWLAAEPTRIVEGPNPTVEVNMDHYLEKAKAYQEQGIHVLSGFQWIPRVMSSRPHDESRSAKSWDAGPKYLRVPPKDTNVWKAYVREIVRQGKAHVDAWEVGNEPNMPDSYWGGTTDEFCQWFNQTVAAILEADPDAFIVGPGFTLEHSALPFFRRMLELGNGQHLDAVSVHSLYGKQVSVAEVRSILQAHGLGDLPLWSTEPKHAVPLRNFNAGIAVNTHFLLFPPGADFYEQFQNLSRGDMAATHAGLAYALGAHIIGKARVLEPPRVAIPDVELALFEQAGTRILAVQADEGPRGAVLNVDVKGAATYTDALGQSARVPQGIYHLPLDRSGFLHHAEDLKVEGASLPERTTEDGFDVSITEATLRNGFSPRHTADRGDYVTVYLPRPELPASERPEVVFPVELPNDGTYEFYLNVQWMANRYRQLSSPLEWSVDGRDYHPVNETSAHWRKSTREHLRFGRVLNPENETIQHVDMMCRIGSLRRLRAGSHTLRVRLAGPRQHDLAFSAEIGDLVFRQVADDLE